MNYYTLQITYGANPENKVVEFKDIELSDLETLRAKVYTIGIKIQTAPGTWEWISPLRIHTAFAIKQDRKYGA